ncbi:uncharacterized protein E0L32_007579 [Thyridium curvatum]|uniref:Uncharacterized protein n=1 Tax=Thyridium curvatum TaxID=1093900 RepID=A0A507APH1_9PEZI|nr:uncharacterized protein E0L32_007579 [Thyridium curvatum]TPX11842.1 hypothetical protein E0L32_007579 [Thyridium curvatum]
MSAPEVKYAYPAEKKVAQMQRVALAPFSALGLVPEFGSVTTFAQSMGVHRANDILMFGEKITVQELKHHGLVNRIFPQASFHQSVLDFLEQELAKNDGQSMMEAKRLQNLPLRRGRILAVYDAAEALSERIVEDAQKKRFEEKHARLQSTMEGSRTAILTGAASGIGEAIARDLIRTGWNVACLDWQKDVGEALVAELGPQAHFVHCDVADYDQQAQAFKTVWQKYGRMDAVLANAGIFDRSSLYLFESRGMDEIPPRPDTKCTDVDFKAVLYSIQLAVHFMRKNAVPGGHLIATSSLAGRHAHPCFPEYSGAKAAKENISVNVVLPGIVATKLTGASTLASVNPQR